MPSTPCHPRSLASVRRRGLGTPDALLGLPCRIIGGGAIVASLSASCLHAQRAGGIDSSGFVTRLGGDTLAVERVVTTPDSITGEMITRSPRTARYAYSARLNPAGEVTAYQVFAYKTVQGPAVRLHLAMTIANDSAHVVIHRGDSTQTKAFAAPHGAVPLLEPAFGLHEILVARTLAAHGQRVPFAWIYLPGDVDTGSVTRGPGDSVRIATRTDTIRAAVDGAGHVTAMSDPGGTLQARVTRIPWFDLDRWGREFAARDAEGGGLGALSPRDTVRASVGGSRLVVDYGRPTRRGRQIFGAIVPWNTVWRTGANAATTLVTSQDIMIGETHIPAGTYTLFSVPARDTWTLIVNRKTGEWGTEYDSTADLARIPMHVETVPNPVERFTIAIDGGSGADRDLSLSWDTVVARVPLRAAPTAAGS